MRPYALVILAGTAVYLLDGLSYGHWLTDIVVVLLAAAAFLGGRASR